MYSLFRTGDRMVYSGDEAPCFDGNCETFRARGQLNKAIKHFIALVVNGREVARDIADCKYFILR